MENPSNAGGYRTPSQLVRDLDLQRTAARRLASALDTTRPPYAHPERFEKLAEAISKGNRAIKDTLLRRWGVR